LLSCSVGFAGLARFLESCCSFLRHDLSVRAVSLRIFGGTVAVLSYMLAAMIQFLTNKKKRT